MKTSLLSVAAVAAAGVCVLPAFADRDNLLERESGIKIGTRLTLRPYVSFAYNYDSNVDSARSQGNYSSWTVNPGLNIDWKGENWQLAGTAYYQYHAYSSGYSGELNNSSYGERLSFNWRESGWSFSVSESYSRTLQDDDMTESGRGIWRDRDQIGLNAALNYRFNDKFHVGAQGGYYWLDYVNDSQRYAPLYGWSRWTAGGQAGYTFSPWTDVYLSGNYSQYKSDNTGENANESKSYTLHLGVGSYMTKRIQYRISGGWSRYEQSAAGGKTTDGFTYQGHLSWRLADDWTTTLLLSSYYHPSENVAYSVARTDTISWGLTHAMIRGKLNATFDAAYRHVTQNCGDGGFFMSDGDYQTDYMTLRFGLSYRFNRFISVFGNVGYQFSKNHGNEDGYDYNRWRLSCGFRLAY